MSRPATRDDVRQATDMFTGVGLQFIGAHWRMIWALTDSDGLRGKALADTAGLSLTHVYKSMAGLRMILAKTPLRIEITHKGYRLYATEAT